MRNDNSLLQAAALLLILSSSAFAASSLRQEINISSQKVVLTNGLTVIVHEDHKAPIVAVDLWYHVGSKNEKTGKTGFAHLFEHLMFTGSEHARGDYDQVMEQIGATDLNGTTSWDRTDFFEDVPTNAFDIALWMESDRMGHLLGGVDQARLDTQRGVVQNEKRQDENEPYGLADELITKGTVPAGHPYSWSPIGSMEDLNAASLDDVKTWFRTYYGAANVTLVVSGDVQAADALKKVEKYFGGIPSGPPVARFKQWVAEMPEPRREIAHDRVPQTRIYKVWNIPAYGDPDAVALEVLTSILSEGKSSRLYKRLVYDEQLATDVSADIDPREICGQFAITVSVAPGKDPRAAETALDQEIARLSVRGPADDEVQRAKTQYFARFIRQTERLGGFEGVADILAMNQTYRGDPNYYKTVLDIVDNLTPADLRAACRRWLGPGVYTLQIDPFPQFGATTADVDRSRVPDPGPSPKITFPTLQRATLPNGLKVILAQRAGTPMVTCHLILDAGFAADEFASPGAARLAMAMLEEGSSNRTALQISDDLSRLGATFSAGNDLDDSTASLVALQANLEDSLALFANVVLHPAFPATNFARLQKEALSDIRQEKADPNALARRLLPPLLFGANHAYGNPFTGSGSETAVAKLTPADMRKFHDTWFKPNHATFVAVGAVQLDALTAALKRHFGSWQPGDIPRKDIGSAPAPVSPRLYAVDRPGSIQSRIVVASVIGNVENPAQIAMQAMNSVLGGKFTSRLNMNLREDKHWSYGASSTLMLDSGPGVFYASAAVQTDKTKESLQEMDKEFRAILDQRPISDPEAALARNNLALRLPGNWETQRRVAASIDEIVRFGRPDDYFQSYPEKVMALAPAEMQSAARDVIRPDQLTWIVIGDRAKIEAGLNELGWGKVQFLNPDGQSID